MDLSEVKTLIITGFGLNCERETAAAFELAGATAEQVHLNDLLARKRSLSEFHVLAFIGGFSFGDHLGAGTVFANRIKYYFREDLERFVGDGKLVIGICNGFQTLTRLGLVPALDGALFQQQCAIAHNDDGVFRDDWVNLKINPDSPCVFSRGVDTVRLPIRHGEGKFVAEPETLARIKDENLVVARYADETDEPTEEFPANPNGSLDAIAGICDPSGRIFGLMPHPEAFLSPYNDPEWTRKRFDGPLPEHGEGLVFFKNAVEFAAESLQPIASEVV